MTILLEHRWPEPAASIELERAILETLAYSDVFDYPLRVEEIHRYVPLAADDNEIREVLSGSESVGCRDGFYFLAGREEILAVRSRREAASRPRFRQAVRVGRLLGRLPFIRMVALTGSLALLNSDESADLDYMLVARRGRVWIARGFALLLNRLTALWGYTLCPNLIVSEEAIEWKQRDLYSAREICQMVPVAGREVYNSLRCRNTWTQGFLPNASSVPPLAGDVARTGQRMQWLLEWPLRGALGDRVERWEMERKVRRFKLQAGFGEETDFGPNMCQGNFDHHGLQTLQAWRERLERIGIPPSPEGSQGKARR